jgi:glycosyltransferase involved in cell wall biosynthesis
MGYIGACRIIQIGASMDLQNKLLSVVIPAYNQPDYLRRALQSAIDQSYRPLDILVADDCSPISLESVVKEFSGTENELLKIRYFRHVRNRGAAENFRFCFEQASGKYVVLLPHDNRLIDRGFFFESIEIMARNPDCYLCCGNAIYEVTSKHALNIPSTISFHNGWALMEGKDFVLSYRRGGMGWSQALVLDHEMASSLKAYDEPFAVHANLSRRLGIAQDDAFSYVYILSCMGSVALCEKIVCEIGTPQRSYSRSSDWKDSRAKVKFIIFYNIYCEDLKGRYAPYVKRMALKQALQYADHILDFRIAKYYNWSFQIVLMMGFGLVKRAWSELHFFLKRAVNTIRPNTFRKTNR